MNQVTDGFQARKHFPKQQLESSASYHYLDLFAIFRQNEAWNLTPRYTGEYTNVNNEKKPRAGRKSPLPPPPISLASHHHALHSPCRGFPPPFCPFSLLMLGDSFLNTETNPSDKSVWQ